MKTWENGSIRYGNIRCFVPAGEKGQNEILALPPAGDELSEFQSHGQQRDQIHPLRKYRSPLPDLRMHPQRPLPLHRRLKRPLTRSFHFNSCSRSWKYSGQKNSSTVILRPSQTFLIVATVVVWFRPLIMLLSVDCVIPLKILKRLIVIFRSSHSVKMRRRTASPTVITTTPAFFS